MVLRRPVSAEMIERCDTALAHPAMEGRNDVWARSLGYERKAGTVPVEMMAQLRCLGSPIFQTKGMERCCTSSW